MNIYTYTFTAECPNNKEIVKYELEIVTESIILAEDILKTCELAQGFHEDIADSLFNTLGGVQTIIAIHSGVKIVTIRE